GVVWCLTLLEAETREPKRGPASLLLLAALIGCLVGLGGLTRYAFGWVILPVVFYVFFIGGQKRIVLALTTFLVFAAVLTPWIVRNYMVSGTPFGTATYTIMAGTEFFPEHRLERSLNLEVSLSGLGISRLAWDKLITNSRQLLQEDLPKLGGSWLSAFFLVGLLVGFRSIAVRRIRYFVVGCLALLILVQALGRTQLSVDSPVINSENLLVLLTPLVVIFGVSLFLVLLENINLPFPQLRLPVIAIFGGLVSLPLILTFLPPRTVPVAYPPYYPPAIQSSVGWVKEDELIMSDIPWAIAWYGQSQSVWLTLNQRPDFYAINDYLKPIHELFISHVAMDERRVTLGQWMKGGEQNWGEFILGCLIRKNQNQPGPPAGFPLRYWQPGWPELFLLTSREQWPKD
ncbi:MAG TPA: hypothetical protein VEC99_12765, partial [Clostridia bacterium]|nr:hypothetical protein [Clostridia bacterium]